MRPIGWEMILGYPFGPSVITGSLKVETFPTVVGEMQHEKDLICRFWL